MKIIVVSTSNIASKNIAGILTSKYKLPANVEVKAFEQSVLNLPLENLKADLIIMPSTHKSEAGVNTLTCHTTGNWSSAEMGGQARTLSIAPALYLKEALLELKKQQQTKNLKYEVSLEVTHHGPTPNLPVIFVEVGSSEKQWNDLTACEAVADTIYHLLTKEPEKVPVAVGFGGPHYAPAFTRKVLEGEIAFGHICPKYQADNLDEKMILQAFERTTPKPDFAAIEWKGLIKGQRDNIIGILEKNKINWKKL